jgi:hypothetical protein
MSTDYADQGQRRSAIRKAWVKKVLAMADKVSGIPAGRDRLMLIFSRR